eukprot:snap_masked-scaffold_26-processed-gene-2.40-mRNA-1 protein AED:1.00 eAED:1.00 QI:0/0/0/0/1/1/2/0/63
MEKRSLLAKQEEVLKAGFSTSTFSVDKFQRREFSAGFKMQEICTESSDIRHESLPSSKKGINF